MEEKIKETKQFRSIMAKVITVIRQNYLVEMTAAANQFF